MVDYKKQGKKNRAAGKAFELKVRKSLENSGWLVFRNSNDVEISKDVVINANEDTSMDAFNRKRFCQAKSKWNPFTRNVMMMQSGFPDFLAIRLMKKDCPFKSTIKVNTNEPQEVSLSVTIFVECKTNGTLSKIEKEKVQWILDNLHIPVFVASKGEKRGTIIYEEQKII